MNKNTIRNVALATTAGVIALAGSTFAADATSTSTTAVQPTVRTKIAQWKDKIQNKKQAIAQKKDSTTRNDNSTSSSTDDTRHGKGMGPMGEMMRGDKGDMKGMKGKGMGEGMHMGMKKNPAVEAALKANDYNAFVTAWNADTHKPTNATAPTQAQFTEMVAHYTKQQAKESAIEKNDYNAFVAATTPTPAEFAKIVAQHATHKAIEAAITANDYNAFVTAWNADTNKPENATVPTQAEFTKMVARHTDAPTASQK